MADGEKGRGWVGFAGVILALVGTFNIVGGLAAIDKNPVYLEDSVLFSNLEAWGWFFLIWGIIQVLAGFAILRGAPWGALVGIVTAFVNALAQLAWLNTNPTASFIIIIVDVLVIYGLVAYGGRRDLAA